MTKVSERILVLIAAALMVTGVAQTAVGDLVDDTDASGTEPAERLEDVGFLLETTDTVDQPLPDEPVLQLINVTETFSEELGYEQDASDEILTSGISEEVAGRLALLLEDMLACHRITQDHFDKLPEDELLYVAYTGDGLDPANFTDIRTCAQSVDTSWEELSLTMTTLFSPPEECSIASLDIWPVIRFDGVCENGSEYVHDYALLVDLGGHDTYKNNIGSNMIDLKRGPDDSVAIRDGPATGCQMAIPGLASGNCTPTASVLLDMANEDTYGILQDPDVDSVCTEDKVHRRMVTGGVGFLGVGMLIDASDHSNDNFTGKTVSQGGGHVFGVGLLHDAGGNDDYLTVRNSQGFALVGGAGVLHDLGGNDVYDFYLPEPKDPDADNEEDGAGGVIDDEGLCDRLLRFHQGGGNVGTGPTIGALVDEGGNDEYHGGFSANFSAPAPAITTGRAGSQGFGNNGGAGVLIDRAGSDTYEITNQIGEQGDPQKEDGRTILPGEDSTGPGGLFIDAE